MTVHQKFLDSVEAFKNDNLTLPSPALQELKLEYIEIIPATKIVAKLPFQKRFTNPVGVFQGGMLSASIDEVFGPLSYMTAGGPCMTLSMNVTFLGSFKETMSYCLIEANVLKKTKNFIFMRSDVTSPEGELLAHAETHVKVL